MSVLILNALEKTLPLDLPSLRATTLLFPK